MTEATQKESDLHWARCLISYWDADDIWVDELVQRGLADEIHKLELKILEKGPEYHAKRRDKYEDFKKAHALIVKHNLLRFEP